MEHPCPSSSQLTLAYGSAEDELTTFFHLLSSVPSGSKKCGSVVDGAARLLGRAGWKRAGEAGGSESLLDTGSSTQYVIAVDTG